MSVVAEKSLANSFFSFPAAADVRGGGPGRPSTFDFRPPLNPAASAQARPIAGTKSSGGPSNA